MKYASPLLAALLACSLPLASCDCGGGGVQDKDAGSPSADGGDGDGASVDATGTDTSPGQDRIIDQPDPNRPDNDTRDSDCDGLSDAEEYGNVYAGGGATDPSDPDSDGDGIDDGIEVGRTSSVDDRCTMFVGDADPSTQTDPTDADTDGDGVDDGTEDADQDGAYEPPAELNPRNPDSDGDGQCDGPSDVAGVCVGGDPDPYSAVNDQDRDGVPDAADAAPTDPDRDGDGLCDGPRDVAGTCVGGEDLNGDGVVSAGETDPDSPDTDCDGVSDADELALGLNPRKADTDGDLIPDGVELGNTVNLDPGACPDVAVDADPSTSTDPLAVDTDEDGINDGIEDADRDGQVDGDETDPNNADTDGDGLCDGPSRVISGVCTGGEDLNGNGQVDGGETDPRTVGGTDPDADQDGVPDAVEQGHTCLEPGNPDTDGDGLCDGHLPVSGVCAAGEDLNHNGRVDPGETDPCALDSDCDGLVDGDSFGDYLGEASLGTNPANPDSDGDGLPDGLEAGVDGSAGAAIPTGTSAGCGFVADANGSTTTNPTNADSDSDGVIDGAEDADQDGQVDPGELDPNDGADATPAVLAACALARLVPVDHTVALTADQQVATARRSSSAFTERTLLTDTAQGGRVIGQMGFDDQTGAIYLALTAAPVGADALAEEAAGRTTLEGVANLSTPITYAFTTWDGFEAVHGSYDMAGNVGAKARANAIAQAFVGTAADLLDTAGDVTASGGFKIEAEFVRRSAQTAVILVALLPANLHSGQAFFTLKDLADGSAMAQATDTTGVQCDRFEAQGYAPVDILWSVDNSVSMNNEQAQVAAGADALEARLNRATVDWRVAIVSSGFYQPRVAACINSTCGSTYEHQCRWFTSDINTFKGWFTEGDPTWIGAGKLTDARNCNVPDERVIRGAELMFTPGSATANYMPPQASADEMHLREGANLVLILVGDADDQHYTNAELPAGIDTYEAFFRALPVASFTTGGIPCPDGSCGETQRNPHVITGFVNRFGGVLGDLSDINSIAPTIDAIIDDVTGAVSPYVLSKDAISSTIKVSMDHDSTIGACAWDDVPRDRTNGFDYDSRNRTIAFFGDCRPISGSPPGEIAVSYRYWIDRTPDPDGVIDDCDCTPPEVCDPVSLECYCPPDCGAGVVPPEQVCDTATCTLTCRPDCGASCPGASLCNADPATCACECPPDCGGASPGGGFVCDRDAASAAFCSYVCPECLGSPSNPAMTCDLATCTWTCPDCDACPGLSICNETTCACDCNQTLTCDAGYEWDAEACDCVCDAASLGCDEAHYADSQLCACVCQDNCNDTCQQDLICNESLCVCLPTGG